LGTLFVAVAAVVSRLLLRLDEAAAAIESWQAFHPHIGNSQGPLDETAYPEMLALTAEYVM